MARTHTPRNAFLQAWEIAKAHGMFISERSGQFHVYRKTPVKPVHLGHSCSANGLFRLVSKLTK